MSTACHQIEVFSRVLKTSVCGFLEDGEHAMDTSMSEFAVSIPLIVVFYGKTTTFSIFVVC